MKMKKLILAAGFGLSFFAIAFTGQAIAASCEKNFTFVNTNNGPITFKIQSRTRANATWYDGGLIFSDRRKVLLAGRTAKGTITYPVLGCGVKRKIRIRIACLDKGQRAIGRRVINVSRGEWHRPYDLKSKLNCN
ncbi:MAG: hypothetical protein RIC18_06505 [Hoeflea sp.]|uniref:hypothetical protein n=1 Tax=Hoeflea sp. TaxID=1940281 RepID=UPI0032EB2830